MIERLQKALGIDVRYYLSGGGYLLVSHWVPPILLILSTWFLTSYLPKEAYGAYSYIQSLLGMLIVFTLPGYYNAVLRSSARGRDGALLVSVRRRLLFSLIGSLILIGVAIYYWHTGDLLRAKGCLVGSGFLGLVHGLDDFRAFLNGKKQYAQYAAYHISLQFAITAVTIATLLLSRNFLVVLAANLATRGAGQVLCVIGAAKSRENDDLEKDFTQFGNRLSVFAALGSLSFYLDGVLIGSLMPLAVMADFNLAGKLAMPLRNFGVIINRLIFPKMVKKKGRAFALKTFYKAFYLAVVLSFVGVVFYFALPYVLTWFFPKYESCRSYAALMMFSELISVMVIYLETYYLSQEKYHRTYYVMNVIRPVSILVLLPLLFMMWGVYGAIAAKLVVRAAEAVYLMLRLFFGWDENSSENEPGQ